MRMIVLLPMVLLISACASTSETDADAEPQERTSGFQVTASAGGDSIQCPHRNSTCYHNVVRACGDLGVEEVGFASTGHVSTAGRGGSSDDPFARVEGARDPSRKPVLLRCRPPKTKPGS